MIRPTPGRLLLWVRQKFSHGLRVAYYRDVVRLQILETAPVKGLTDTRCEIHVLTSQQDWLNLVWTLKSFYSVSGRKYRLCIHDDGSLDGEAKRQLSQHFPNARLIERVAADHDVLPSLDQYPRCRAFRQMNHLSPKLFDFRYYLQSDRMMLLDSDVLFFAEPSEFLRRVESREYRNNTVNGDSESAYTIDAESAMKHCGVNLIACFNSGMGLIHAESLNVRWIEEFLAIPGILGHFWRIEQTLYALLSSRFGVELLPTEYTLSLAPHIGNRPFRHYVGCIRHLMYREGMRELARRGLLNGALCKSGPRSTLEA